MARVSICHQVHSRISKTCSYPIRTQSGATPIIFGHESGLTVLWKDSDTSELVKDAAIFVSLGSAVIDIAVPQVNSENRLRLRTLPKILSEYIMVVASCSDYVVRAFLLSLEPVAQTITTASEAYSASCAFPWQPTSISLTWTSLRNEEHEAASVDEDQSTKSGLENIDWLVAAASGDGTPRLAIAKLKSSQRNMFKIIETILLPQSPLKVVFNPATYPSKSHSQLLVASASGLVHIYDFDATRSAENTTQSGSWIATFSTKFEQPKIQGDVSYIIPKRKRILDAQWASNGRVIILLLADGEWGLWDVSNSQVSKKSSNMTSNSLAIWGMISSGIPSHLQSSGTKKSLDGRRSLPTQTPNTKRLKEENLFVGQSPLSNALQRGGISVKAIPLPSADNSEDSVVIWYNDTICYIDSLQSYWSRAVKRSTDSRLSTSGGSLFGPGLTRIESIEFQGHIECISLLVSQPEIGKSASTSLVLATQYQLTICPYGSQTVTSSRKSVYSKHTRNDSKSQSILLKRGELGIDMLDSMIGNMTGRHANSNSLSEDQDGDVFMSGALNSNDFRLS